MLSISTVPGDASTGPRSASQAVEASERSIEGACSNEAHRNSPRPHGKSLDLASLGRLGLALWLCVPSARQDFKMILFKSGMVSAADSLGLIAQPLFSLYRGAGLLAKLCTSFTSSHSPDSPRGLCSRSIRSTCQETSSGFCSAWSGDLARAACSL